MYLFVGYYYAIIKTNLLFMGFFLNFLKKCFVCLFSKTNIFVLYGIFYCYC